MTVPHTIKTRTPIRATVICGMCHGMGRVTVSTDHQVEPCPECHGKGEVVVEPGPMPREEIAAATGCLLLVSASVAFFWLPLVWRLLR